ncbi:hypothetical protein HFO09_29785 [Rhizobium laguerreae]|uniref:N-acetylmuramoyl-L-alanine amidase n=1 Tax=Rhizobium laguerreae TaxID=1076926 RepID=UPI001C902E17|nr:N-acetylmuramoyl-L-alanine amidase [Rhizobium laguerreae]MBY3258702.1 hypothetical protein [Rhizobium laguerreae]MBY3286539.1 hypothetical protein [Rhizobium laguerreae]MBY3293202.1 hypothetical protein [Rhizobium laguerreae]
MLRYAWSGLICISAVCLCLPAWAFHGFSFEMHAGDRAVTIYFDPQLGAAANWDYVSQPTGVLADLTRFAQVNQERIAALPRDYQVFLSADIRSWTYIVETVDGSAATAVREVSDAGDPQAALFERVLCAEPIALTCDVGGAAQNIVVIDGSTGEAAREALPQQGADIPKALVTFRPMGAGLDNTLLVMRASDIPNIEAPTAPLGVRVGSIQEALSGLGTLFEVAPAQEEPIETPPPPEERGDFRLINRTGYPKGHQLDSRLQFIVLHCTAGSLSRAAVLKIKSAGQTGVGHTYVMPDGENISIWDPTTNPNKVLATKTELQKCSATRSRAFRAMYHIEMNYPCHWDPTKSPDPSKAQVTAVANHISAMFKDYGPFHILAHTYVDMGINSRYAHTDPQGRNGFDFEGLYKMIEANGVDLASVIKVEQSFAKSNPISKRDVRHSFPPVLTHPLPHEAQGSADECVWTGP